MRSLSEMFWQPVTYQAFIRILRCVSIAALGEPVVPEVYWILTTSVAFSLLSIASNWLSSVLRPPSTMASQGRYFFGALGLIAIAKRSFGKEAHDSFPSCTSDISGQASSRIE